MESTRVAWVVVLLLLPLATSLRTPQRAALLRPRAARRAPVPFSAAFSLPADGAVAQEDAAPLKVLYDGLCMVCLTNKRVLTWFDKRKTKLEFVDIRASDYNPAVNGNIAFEDAMRHFHVIDGVGAVHEGSDAVMTAYSAVGLGWLMAVLRFPLIRVLIDASYSFVSKYRHQISRWLPGGKALAQTVDSLSEMSAGAHGLGCDDEEECMLDYDDDDD